MQLDPHLLRELTLLQRVCLALTTLLALDVLAVWLFPALGRGQPWYMVMNPWAAVALLVGSASMALCERGCNERARAASQVLAALVGLLMVTFFLKNLAHGSLGAYRFLRLAPGQNVPGMTLQTAVLVTLLSIVMVLLCVRRPILNWFADACLSVLCFTLLVAASEHVFNATQIFGVLRIYSTAPATLVGLMLLTFVAFGRRAECGIFRILLGGGIGSNAARIAFPMILVMPFVLEVARDRALRAGFLGLQGAAAVQTSLAAVLALGLVLALAWRIETLEREVGQLSLSDELTGVYNRRGFYLFARQTLHVAQRSHAPLSILFVDLDNLKQINDGFGHETGSRFLLEVGEILKESFRKTDVIGRVGGDEFVVAGQSSEADMQKAVQRMKAAAAERDADPARPYPFRVSLGYATMPPDANESLEELIARADRNMYETKRESKLFEMKRAQG